LRVSLSSLLRAGKGPVWDWFEASLPNTRAVSTEANRRLRGGPAGRPCDIAPPSGSDCSLVGTAVGYLLTACLRPDALRRGSVAASGAALLDRVLPSVDCAATERAVVVRLEELLGSGRPAKANAWREACLLCVVLARFEQWFRAGPVVAEYTVRPLTAWKGGSLEVLGRSMAGGPTIKDLMSLGSVVVEDHGDMALAETLHIGPTFLQSAALGGADADLICEGLLLDLKSSGQARVVGRDELWQLAGYLLADTVDEYDIHSVGFAALRWRRCTYWPAQAFLDELGGADALLPEWRARFNDLLRPLRAQHKQQRGERMRMKGARPEVS
jgi:hypothetical protein